MMNFNWNRNILERGIRRTATILLFGFGLLSLSSPTSNLETLGRTYLKLPTAANEAALLRYAAANPKQESSGLAFLLIGAAKAETGEPESAIKLLTQARDRLPKLKDYINYYIGKAYYRGFEYDAAVEALESVVRNSPVSPLRARAILLIAVIHRETRAPKEAISLLRKYANELPQPEGLETLALSLEDAGDSVAAVAIWQRLYSDYANLPVATRAATAFIRLRARLGASYPPLMPQALFSRVDRLITVGEHNAARRELQGMTEKLAGASRDRARVWLGRIRHLRRQDAIAYKWLKGLKASNPEVEAERLYYLLVSARRTGRLSEMFAAMDALNKRHRSSEWRLQGLMSVGNHYVLRNEPAKYEPVYKECLEVFPFESDAVFCHWKLTWSAYLKRSPDASTQIRQHLQLFPKSPYVPPALYFLGRMSEHEEQMESARGYYERLASRYTNYYYATLAAERLAEGPVSKVSSSTFVREFLNSLKIEESGPPQNFTPTAATRERLARARLLLSVGYDDWAETELRFGARNGAQAPLLAMELSRLAATRGDFARSIRYIKGMAPGYLSIPIENAPDEFWQLAYPIQYRAPLERYSKERDLDPYFMAALIRQESEFDPKAISRASARGLTQIMPSTGRSLSRKLGYRRFRTSMLYQPDVNINMGSYYFRTLVEGLDGHVEAALASYNAGMSRAREWLTWADYREPAEFIETIPFTETRNYVQIVLRNASIYRRVYGVDDVGKKSPVADARAQ
jgi:soluble lytic murein transglycosylase